MLSTIFAFVFFVNQTSASGIPENYLKKIEFKDRIYKMELNIAKHPDFFDIYTKYYYKDQEVKFASGSIIQDYIAFDFDIVKKEVSGINRGAIMDYIRKELIPKYDRVMQPVRIFRNPDNKNKIEFEGNAVDGRNLNVDKLANLIIFAIENEADSIILPFDYEPAKLTVEDEELKKLGIKDLIATGESDFSVSSWNRKTNIRIGIASFSGLLLQKGEVFSIGKELGAITAAKGYKSELVIKGNETIPELGGGLCQVSTTTFRGALQAGFEIVERWPHAYAVFHYEPYGTDSTIYPPLKDFKFKNNTQGAILIQTYLDEEGEIAYVNYLGTKDERQVNILGPYVSHWKYPSTKKYEPNPNLQQAQKMILNAAYNGFSVYWQRDVTLPENIEMNKNSEEYLSIMSGASLPQYELFSQYRPSF